MTNHNDDRKDEDEQGGPVKAYKDMDFMTSRSARALRILSEFIEPEDRFERYNISDTIVFFGSARTLSKATAEAALVAAEKHGGGKGQRHERTVHRQEKRCGRFEILALNPLD